MLFVGGVRVCVCLYTMIKVYIVMLAIACVILFVFICVCMLYVGCVANNMVLCGCAPLRSGINIWYIYGICVCFCLYMFG